jgi:hypothetical protein
VTTYAAATSLVALIDIREYRENAARVDAD